MVLVLGDHRLWFSNTDSFVSLLLSLKPNFSLDNIVYNIYCGLAFNLSLWLSSLLFNYMQTFFN